MKVETIIMQLAHNPIVQAVVLAVVMDTIFGVGRAIKERRFNSCVGIDGVIRKISMLVSLAFMGVADTLMGINLIGFVPDEIVQYLPEGLQEIGLASFFGLLYLGYEIVSILKNMALCGLPVKQIWISVQKFLGKYTQELPDTEEQDMLEEKVAETGGDGHE